MSDDDSKNQQFDDILSEMREEAKQDKSALNSPESVKHLVGVVTVVLICAAASGRALGITDLKIYLSALLVPLVMIFGMWLRERK